MFNLILHRRSEWIQNEQIIYEFMSLWGGGGFAGISIFCKHVHTCNSMSLYVLDQFLSLKSKTSLTGRKFLSAGLIRSSLAYHDELMGSKNS